MEYCPGGTLADAAKAGLPEEMIRKYTKELLVAVNVLHEHDIVHRDIKGELVLLSGCSYLRYNCIIHVPKTTLGISKV